MGVPGRLPVCPDNPGLQIAPRLPVAFNDVIPVSSWPPAQTENEDLSRWGCGLGWVRGSSKRGATENMSKAELYWHLIGQNSDITRIGDATGEIRLKSHQTSGHEHIPVFGAPVMTMEFYQ
ncbi:hypothetical protein B0H13DRAFT_1856283 [Mycena leptocephala]|nr:hypothetical protein B0H13DRAFT_1856283 [Mycena leptocephala]